MARTFGRLIDLTSAPRRIVRATVCAALIASASEAAAQQPTQHTINADAIFRGCKILAEGGTADVVLQSAGAGFLFGLASLPQDLSPPEWRSCPPSGSNPSQFAQALVKYIEAHPERIREDFRGLTLAAFHDTWPCSNWCARTHIASTFCFVVSQENWARFLASNFLTAPRLGRSVEATVVQKIALAIVVKQAHNSK
jgi:Rap1a immunity proteins